MTTLFTLDAVNNISSVAVEVLLKFNLMFPSSGLNNLSFFDVRTSNTVLFVAFEHAFCGSFWSRMLRCNLGTNQHFTDGFGTFECHQGGKGEDFLHVRISGEGPVVFVEDLLRVGEPGVISHDKDWSVDILLPDNLLDGLLPGDSLGSGDGRVNDARLVVSGQEKSFQLSQSLVPGFLLTAYPHYPEGQ